MTLLLKSPARAARTFMLEATKMYNGWSELDEELKRLAKEVDDAMDGEITQVVADDEAAWLNEQIWVSKALRDDMKDVGNIELSKQAYADAAKKTMTAKTEAFTAVVQILGYMEDKLCVIREGDNVLLSECLDEFIVKVKDTLDFGVAKEDETALVKRYASEFVGMKEDAYSRMYDGCLTSVMRQDENAGKKEKSGVSKNLIVQESAKDAYFDGAYLLMGDVVKLNAMMAALLKDLENTKRSMDMGAADIPASVYFEDAVPKVKGWLKGEFAPQAIKQKIG
jgi:hypothetical protein